MLYTDMVSDTVSICSGFLWFTQKSHANVRFDGARGGIVAQLCTRCYCKQNRLCSDVM